MSRSYKKPWVWISKSWDHWRERANRHRVKQELRWDPDRDWEELVLMDRPGWGTKCGFDVPPDESEGTELQEEYERSKRK